MVKKTYSVPDMHCTNCAMRLESIEDDLPGIKQISASYHKLQMIIEYDESQVSETEIIAAVKNKGYEVLPA